jgi:hypothetical protein
LKVFIEVFAPLFCLEDKGFLLVWCCVFHIGLVFGVVLVRYSELARLAGVIDSTFCDYAGVTAVSMSGAP